MAEQRAIDIATFGKWPFVVGVVASLLCAAVAVIDPTAVCRAYMYAYVFVLGFPLGSLALVMIYHLTGGAWGLLIRRIAEAQTRTLPLMAVLFTPIALGLPYIYAWADPAVTTAEEHQGPQAALLQPVRFYWRSAGYFVGWMAIALLLSYCSTKQDGSADVRIAWFLRCFSGPALVLFSVLLHFASIDWIMSLQTEVTSTVIGPLVFSSHLLSALALALVVYALVYRHQPLASYHSADATGDLGSLLFTFLVLWGYMEWFQFMLIWMANLPHGAVWYLARSAGLWRWVVLTVVILHLALPLFVLLIRPLKRDPAKLGIVAAWLLVVHWFYMLLLIMPVFSPLDIIDTAMCLIAPLAIGGLWLSLYLRLLARRPLVPLHDISFDSATRLRNNDRSSNTAAIAVGADTIVGEA